MKKLIATLVIGGFLTAGLIGCGPTASTGGSTSGPANTGAPAPVKGKVTKSDAGKITVEGKEYDASAAKVTIDGAAGKAADIKTDNTVTITLDKDSKVTDVDVKTK